MASVHSFLHRACDGNQLAMAILNHTVVAFFDDRLEKDMCRLSTHFQSVSQLFGMCRVPHKPRLLKVGVCCSYTPPVLIHARLRQQTSDDIVILPITDVLRVFVMAGIDMVYLCIKRVAAENAESTGEVLLIDGNFGSVG